MNGRPRRGLHECFVALAAALLACGGAPGPRAPSAAQAENQGELRVVKGQPVLAVVARDGDPRGAVAVAVATGGIAPERGAEPAVALAALVEARLEGRGVDATVTPGWDGYRARALLADAPGDAARVVDAMRAAMLAPVTDAEMARVKKKTAALAQRPMRDAALLDAVRCTGEAYALASDGAAGHRAASAPDRAPAPSAADVEAWRRAAHGAARVAFAVAGDAKLADDAARAMARGGAWPEVSAPAADPLPAVDASAEVYDASGDAPAGGARATLAVHVARAAVALAAAPAVGDPRGPLASRLGALDAPAKVRDVVAAAHPRGGCLAVTIEMSDAAPASVATAVALARQEIAVELADAAPDALAGRAVARRAADPRDAAERAAWWALSADAAAAERPGRSAPDERASAGEARASIAVGIAGGQSAPSATRDDAPALDAAAVRGALDRATLAWHEPVVEAKSKVERGQGELWLLVGSPCGTMAEAAGDAGLGAAVALATAREDAEKQGVKLEPWIAADGIGVVAHAPALAGEGATTHARRVADAAARAFGADPVSDARASAARRELLRADDADEPRAVAALSDALAPGHPSWINPLGTADGLARSSDLAVALRASALRAGPLRVAVLANADAAQADAAVRAADRWIARRPGEARACPAPTSPGAPRPGTYPVDSATGATEALLGLALPAGDDAARASATWVALALDGPDGLLAKALGAGLARAWSARVLGAPRAPALVITVRTAPGALDAAVAQTRALLDRLRQGALTDADRSRALAARDRAHLAAQLDPRARLVALWRGEPLGAGGAAPAPPALDALRAFCASSLKDDALAIVALRPRPAKPDKSAPAPPAAKGATP